MSEGYAIYRATLGPRGCQDFGVRSHPFASPSDAHSEAVSICIALDDDTAYPLDDLAVYDLDVVGAETVGAINLSELRWGAKWPEGRWLLDGRDLGNDLADDPEWSLLVRTEGHV